ncbi:MAG: hypothetical protein A2571_02075 [Candidatus Vogelbacteria bacterium RIFOXYD1_FULL_44_32]|uniref:Uncharacterized protein n=1 Tax=Candidatus Vogelbacteria bacterium RIFOXYD1_FULL_44_32 TaxID=1802438 RepID=A0A1G2QEY0_9BACT|nr:MAG: hypothetical protein A2571_02075 [Candidatus Vogelbacteria bacterium RIFOXYD1_FULL_44_32]
MFSIAYAATDIPLLGAVTKVIVNPILAFMFFVAVAVFFFGLVEFIFKAGGGGDLAEGKQHMIWGIVGLFIMVSVYGILHIICNTIGCSG